MGFAQRCSQECCCSIFIAEGLLNGNLGCLLIDAWHSVEQVGHCLAQILVLEELQGIHRSTSTSSTLEWQQTPKLSAAHMLTYITEPATVRATSHEDVLYTKYGRKHATLCGLSLRFVDVFQANKAAQTDSPVQSGNICLLLDPFDTGINFHMLAYQMDFQTSSLADHLWMTKCL